MTLRPSLLPLRVLLLLPLLLSGAVCRADAGFETESPVRTLQVETLVEPPEPCAEPAAFGDTLHIHYSGSLVDGRIFDTSLTRDPLVIELGQKQVIPGLEQSLLDMCVGEKRRVIVPSHLAYGKRGFPPSIPDSNFLGRRHLLEPHESAACATSPRILDFFPALFLQLQTVGCAVGMASHHISTVPFSLHQDDHSQVIQNKIKQKTAFKIQAWDFPGGAVVKNLPSNAGDSGLIPRELDPTYMLQLRPGATKIN
ncbi:peptidyl-prolyl cis-trans isomerase FKBP11 isoform X1 [Pseudorca crassidens]|uniref:peptidyl-prolyl cis-trans isomerase FKBP11 isoform X1 n=1 Tax=Pseudorca crassidens TaxID=82174 RepID=UPI00352D96B6